jgi:CRP-like cAMP-binding protein
MRADAVNPDDPVAQLFHKGLKLTVKTGEIIARGDDADSWVYFIEKGFIKEYSINNEGREYLQLIYKPGEFFPLSWASIGIKKRLFYEALDSSVLWKLPRDDFISSVQGTAGEVNLAVFERLGVLFSVFGDRLDNLQYKSAGQRVIYRLLFLASRFGEKRGTRIYINAPLSHQLIAESINLSRETVSRELEALIKKNLIAAEGKQIIITDIKGLLNLFDEPISLDYWGLN